MSSTLVVADDGPREGDGQERRRDSNATDSNSTSWQWATDRGAGWKSFDWFEYFYDAASPWIFHADLEWVYRGGDDTDSIWLYFPRSVLTAEDQTVPTYEEWLSGGQKIPTDLVFMGGTPWFDESTGLRRQPPEVYEMIYGKEGNWKWTNNNLSVPLRFTIGQLGILFALRKFKIAFQLFHEFMGILVSVLCDCFHRI